MGKPAHSGAFAFLCWSSEHVCVFVQVFSQEGKRLRTINVLDAISCMCFDRVGTLLVGAARHHRVYAIREDGSRITFWCLPLLNKPNESFTPTLAGLSVHRDGRVFVACERLYAYGNFAVPQKTAAELMQEKLSIATQTAKAAQKLDREARNPNHAALKRRVLLLTLLVLVVAVILGFRQRFRRVELLADFDFPYEV